MGDTAESHKSDQAETVTHDQPAPGQLDFAAEPPRLADAAGSRDTERPDGSSGHVRSEIEALRSPVFIVGSPRSGTSILVSALFAAGYHGFREGNFLTLLRLVSSVMTRHKTTFGAPNPKVLASQVNWEVLRGDISAAFKRQVDELNSQAPWLDKSGNPEMIEAIPDLIKLWPSSMFIFAKRRGIENVTSRLLKFPAHNFEYHCRDWARNMAVWREMRQLDGLRAIEVDQQEIAQRPREVAQRVSAFLHGSESFRACLEMAFRGERPQETEHGSAQRVMSIKTTGWSHQKIETFLRHCQIEMDNYGYSSEEGYWSA